MVQDLLKKGQSEFWPLQGSSQGLLLFFYLRGKTALLIEATVAGDRYEEEVLARVSTLGVYCRSSLAILL